jgi:hypothetical protein
MTRDLTAGMLTEVQAQVMRPCIFFEGDFEGGTVRLWTGLGDLTWNSLVWTGAGNLLGLSAVEETTAVVANGITVSLTGIPVEYRSAAIDGARQGKAGRVWFGAISAGALVADPYLLFAGRLDVPEITFGGETFTITITYESRLIDLTRPREWRYTHESQKVLYPGDKGFEFVTVIQEQTPWWGQRGQNRE